MHPQIRVVPCWTQAALAANQDALEGERAAHRSAQQALGSVRRDMAAAEAAAEEVTERLNADVASLEVLVMSPGLPKVDVTVRDGS